MTIQPSNEAIHKMVSLRVLDYVPVRPKSPGKLTWPLRFMTDSCKSSSKLTPKKVRDEGIYSATEIQVSKQILDWKSRIDTSVRDEITNLDTELNEEGTNFMPPLVIRAKSGVGKSILIGKIVAELIDARFCNPDSLWPRFDRIVYSQLKDQSTGDLETAVCEGMDGFHKCDNLDKFLQSTIHEDDKIILIDSLDEHNDRINWWKVSQKLSTSGWKVIWACRDPDWEHHNLGDSSLTGVPKYVPKAGTHKKHWERLGTQLDEWDLAIDDDPINGRMKEINPLIQSKEYATDYEWESHKDKIKQFVETCYSKTQLMHIYHTNSGLKSETRIELDNALAQKILESRLKYVNETSHYTNEDQFMNKQFYARFFDYNLAKTIIQTSLDRLKKRDTCNFDVDEAWKLLCRAYYQAESKHRKPGVLGEEIPSHLMLKDSNVRLLRWLHLTGITRDFKFFRHRDFATIAYVEGCKGGNLAGLSKNEDNKDILFRHFFPYQAIGKKLDKTNQKNIIYDFLRRTGDLLIQSDYYWNLHDDPKNPIAKKARDRSSSHLRGKSSNSIQKSLSELQAKAIRSGANRRAVILHGVPGSGKTYGGIERILFRQRSVFSQTGEGSRVLIVALTKQLATSIKSSLYREHIESQFLKDLIDEKSRDVIKETIFSKFDVLTFSEVIEDWFPEDSFTKGWELDFDSLFNRIEGHNKEIDTQHYRDAQSDFQNIMFDKKTGKIIKKDEYLRRKKSNLPVKVREIWYDAVFRERQRGSIALIEACTILRNLLLKFEHQRKNYPEHLFNSDYEITDVPNKLKIDQSKCFKKFEKRFQQGYYDCIMVDEVQDLPDMAVVMLSCLSPNREPNRFIIAGDELQTLNGQEFKWSDYLDSVSHITREIGNALVHISIKDKIPYNHHFSGIHWDGFDASNVILHHLHQNWRNHKSISQIAVQSWEWWPNRTYFEDVRKEYPLHKMQPMRIYDAKTEKFNPLMIIETNDSNFEERIEETLEFLNSRSNVSLLFANGNIKEYVHNRIMTDKNVHRHVESFSPWTIKGLERDAVVIIGGYTASFHDNDTRGLYEFDYRDTTNERVKREIDLLRRKMIVSLTRAKDQLILIESPESFKKTEKHRFVSLDMPKFTAPGYPEFRVTSEDNLLQELERFFKESRITEDDISVIRISEGLSIIERARNEEQMKKEFTFYKNSLKTVLTKDEGLNNSVLAKLMEVILDLPNAKVSNLLMLNDMMRLEDMERSFKSKADSLENEINTIYSRMVSNSWSFKESEGMWSSDGFKLGYSIIDSYFNLKNKVDNQIKYVALNHAEKPEIIPDVLSVLTGLQNLLEDFSTVLLLPDTEPLDENELVVHLFNYDDTMIKSEYKLADEKFFYKVFLAFTGLVRLNNNGDFVATYSGDQIFVDHTVILKFLEDMNKFEFKEVDSNLQTLRPFTNYFLEMLWSYTLKIDTGDSTSPFFDEESVNDIRDALAYTIGFIAHLKNKNLIRDTWDIISEYIAQDFERMNAPDVEKLLKDVLDTEPNLLRSIDDDVVIKWNFKNFMLFTKALGKSGIEHYQKRERSLYNKTNYLAGLVSHCLEMLHIRIPHQMFDDDGIPERSLYSAGNYAVEKLTEDKAKKDYEDMMNQILLQITEFVNKNKDDVSIFFTDEDSMNNWKNLNIILNLMDKSDQVFMHRRRGLKKREDIFSNISGEHHQNHVTNIYVQISDLLSEIASSRESTNLKELIMNILYLQTIVKRNSDLRKLPDEIVEEFPILQQTGLYKLEPIIKFPEYFAPQSGSSKEGLVSWRNTNSKNTHFESQKDNLRQLSIIANMFETWEIQMDLYRILFNHKVVQGSEKLYWRFDGFGEPIPFSRWMKEIDHLYSKPPKTKINHTWLIHENLNDFHSRLKTYLKLLDVSLEILENDATLAVQANTGLKVLIEKCLPYLFDLNEIWGSLEIYSTNDTREILLSVFPNGKQIELDVKKTGSIAEIRGKEMLEKSDLAQLFKRFGLNYNKFNIEDAIQNLSMHRDLLMKYFELLDEENSEPSESLPDGELGEEDDIEDFDEEDDIEDFDEEDDIEEFDIDDTIEDFDDNQDDDTQESLVFDLTIGDDIEEDDVEDLNEMIFDLTIGDDEHQDDDIQENLVFDLTVVDDDLVKNRFNISNDEWEQLPENKKQEFRDSYVYLN